MLFGVVGGRRSDSLSFRSFAALYHAQTTNSHNIRNLRPCARLLALHQYQCSLLLAEGFVVIPSSSCHIAINIILVSCTVVVVDRSRGGDVEKEEEEEFTILVCVCLLPEKCFAPNPPPIPVQQTGLNHHHQHTQSARRMCNRTPFFIVLPLPSKIRRLSSSSSHGVGSLQQFLLNCIQGILCTLRE